MKRNGLPRNAIFISKTEYTSVSVELNGEQESKVETTSTHKLFNSVFASSLKYSLYNTRMQFICRKTTSLDIEMKKKFEWLVFTTQSRMCLTMAAKSE